MGCGKVPLVLDLIEKEYNKHYYYIIIICPTLRWNKTYYTIDWIRHYENVWLIEPKDKLHQWIKKLSLLLACLEPLYVINDTIADERLGKQRQYLLELVTASRNCNHYLWLLSHNLIHPCQKILEGSKI